MNTVARIEAAKARLSEQRSQLLPLREAGPPCIRCAHFVPQSSGFSGLAGGAVLGRGPFCGHPAYEQPRLDPVRGELSRGLSVSAETARSDKGLCGLEAALFEPRPIESARELARPVWRWGVGFLAVGGGIAFVDLISRLF